MYRPGGSSVNSKIPCEFVLIDFASVRSGDVSDSCTRRIGRPPSAVVTLPLIAPVPLTAGAVGSRGCACCGDGIVALTWAAAQTGSDSDINAAASRVLIVPPMRRSLLLELQQPQIQRTRLALVERDRRGHGAERLHELRRQLSVPRHHLRRDSGGIVAALP